MITRASLSEMRGLVLAHRRVGTAQSVKYAHTIRSVVYLEPSHVEAIDLGSSAHAQAACQAHRAQKR